ncbi:hypothetical protein GWI33_002056 [Rhynchophorus ferrugineus]|uniref:Uncharacterized protein n=1 Tax=Rhynchophorus ferrugineus TaxID=354439 RepID=A0A834IUD5_RHYFE|nr:hypothetical protein GWI33_002056 [Rhynchophorus ferrugineus]
MKNNMDSLSPPIIWSKSYSANSELDPRITTNVIRSNLNDIILIDATSARLKVDGLARKLRKPNTDSGVLFFPIIGRVGNRVNFHCQRINIVFRAERTVGRSSPSSELTSSGSGQG